MTNSTKVFLVAVLSLPAAASVGALMWISSRHRRRSKDLSMEPALCDSPTDTDGTPTSAASDALATRAINGPVRNLSLQRDKDAVQILPFRLSFVPRSPTLLLSAIPQFWNRAAPPSLMAGPMMTSANHSATSTIVGPVTIPSNLQPATTTFSTRRHDVALWWEKIFYKAFESFISRTGQLMHACIVVEISFSFTGITIASLMFIRGPGPNCVMIPPSNETNDVIALFPPAQVVEVPRAELAAGPTSSASLDRQLAITQARHHFPV